MLLLHLNAKIGNRDEAKAIKTAEDYARSDKVELRRAREHNEMIGVMHTLIQTLTPKEKKQKKPLPSSSDDE